MKSKVKNCRIGPASSEYLRNLIRVEKSRADVERLMVVDVVACARQALVAATQVTKG